MGMKYFFAKIFLAISLFGCIVQKKSFIAKPHKNNIENNRLRLDGNYIAIVENSNSGTKGFKIFSLYANGIALENYLQIKDSSVSNDQNVDKKKIVSDIRHKDSLYRGIKQSGGYLIDQNKIVIQVFEFVNYGSFEVCTYRGNIINDSTINISSCYIKSKSNFCPSNFELKFYTMPKTDSINQLMKKKWYWAKK